MILMWYRFEFLKQQVIGTETSWKRTYTILNLFMKKNSFLIVYYLNIIINFAKLQV